MGKSKFKKVQTDLKGFPLFAFEEYLKVLGCSRSECLTQIIIDWINQNSELLTRYEITHKKWREEEEEGINP